VVHHFVLLYVGRKALVGGTVPSNGSEEKHSFMQVIAIELACPG
jgi:hypothetical protein